MKHQPHFAFIGDLTIDKYIDSGEIRLGGAALNMSVWAKRLGIKSSVVTSVGTDMAGKEMIKKLKKEHISRTHLQIRHGKTSSIEINIHANGERHYGVWDPGTLAGYHLRPKDITYLAEMDAVVVTVYPQFEHILQEIAGIKKPSFVVINYGDLKEFGSDLGIVEENLERADMLVFGFDKEFDEERINKLKEVAQAEKKKILITLGSYGSLLYDAGQTYTQIAKEVSVVDTTGAGDAFLTGFLSEYCVSHDCQKSLEKGTESASNVIGQLGAY